MNVMDILKSKSNPHGEVDGPLYAETNKLEERRAEAWLKDRIQQSQKLGPDDLISEVVTITPAMAEVFLRHNRGNRRLRQKRIESWAQQIREGRWKTTSQGISFARDGFLNNGQHRLSAIVMAGRSVRMSVAFGEGRDVFDVLDTGLGRGGADTLHVSGYKNTALLAAATRALAIASSGYPRSNIAVPNNVMKELLEAHPGLEAETTTGHRIAQRLRVSGTPFVVAFYMIRTQSPNVRRLDSFIEALAEGTAIKKRDPIIVLRDGVIKKEIPPAGTQGSARNISTAASTIKAWNIWLHGKTATTKAISWLGGEPFPKPE